MTIDERLDRLTARHEALAQALELMQLIWQEDHRKWQEDHRKWQEDHRKWEERWAKSEERSARWEERWAKIEIAIQQDGENIRALARIAEIHERRLSHLEGEPE